VLQPYPLTRANRLRLARAFATAPRVDTGIDCAIEGQMGEVFVDSIENPAYFLIETDGFFVYIAGDFTTEAGQAFIASMPRGRMFMPGTPGWGEALTRHFGEAAMRVTRYQSSADSLSLNHIRTLAQNNPNIAKIRRLDVDLASINLPFVEIGAFEGPADFVERGIGFCMMDGGKIVACAYSGLVKSNAIEVCIFVEEAYRRQGVATALACLLVEWCLENNLRPNWDAANEKSSMLAKKLGYRPVGTYTAYFVKPEPSPA
jgi:GNAT superfamily N-acetyltransferase